MENNTEPKTMIESVVEAINEQQSNLVKCIKMYREGWKLYEKNPKLTMNTQMGPNMPIVQIVNIRRQAVQEARDNLAELQVMLEEAKAGTLGTAIKDENLKEAMQPTEVLKT